MEQVCCTAAFWCAGEKIELNGLKPNTVRQLSVTGEQKVNLSFLRNYPHLEELTLTEKYEGVEVLSEQRYGGIQKSFVAAERSTLLQEEMSNLTTWLSL